MKKEVLVSLAYIITLVLGQTGSASDIVFNNLGPNDTYSNIGVPVGWAGVVTNIIGANFQPSGSGNLNELWLPMFSNYPSDPLILSVASDSSGLPGSVLWSMTITNQLTTSTILHLENLEGPMLSADDNYWITAQGVSTSGHFVAWAGNGIGMGGVYAKKTQFSSWELDWMNPNPGMKIGVVPEHSTLVLLGMSFVGLLAWTQRRNHKTV